METTALTVIAEPQPALPAELTEALRLAEDFARASKSKATIAAYQSDFAIFAEWCRQRWLSSLPTEPGAVCGFLADEASRGKKAATLSRRIAAVKYFHKLSDLPSPTDHETVKATLAGIRRSIGSAPQRKKAATSDIVLAMVSTLGNDTLRELRDRALLLVAFSSALRRSELVALDVRDLEWSDEGVLIRIARSKTDKEGAGAAVAVPRGEIQCPVAALKDWLRAANISEGAIFRRVYGNKSIGARLGSPVMAQIVKDGARRLGLDPKAFGAHSTRSGLVTSAVKRGVNLIKICDQTRHKSIEMLRVYCRDADLFTGNASAGLL
jgi:site-specific recombinase XerD